MLNGYPPEYAAILLHFGKKDGNILVYAALGEIKNRLMKNSHTHDKVETHYYKDKC